MIKKYFSLLFFICFFGFVSDCSAYSLKSYWEGSTFAGNKAFNIVFCPLHYRNRGDNVFLKDISTVLRRLKKTAPFNEFTDKIRVYYIKLSGEEENKIFKKTGKFPPLRVRQDFLDSLKARLESSYKLIIIDAESFVSCAEVSSVNKVSLVILGRKRYRSRGAIARGFLHEIGHSLGLHDECVLCRRCSGGPPNCAPDKKTAQKWWGDLAVKSSRVGYIQGCCGNKNYIRPTIFSLMNDPEKAKDYGPVNERYLRRELKIKETN